MKEKYFLNGKLILSNAYTLLRTVKGMYWGLNITRISRLFVLLGWVPFISFILILKKEKLLKKRLFLLQQMIKKLFIFDRLLRRNYDYRVDTLAKNGHYRGMRLKSNLPVRGQRTHTNASTSKKLNKKRITSVLLASSVSLQSKKPFKKK